MQSTSFASGTMIQSPMVQDFQVPATIFRYCPIGRHSYCNITTYWMLPTMPYSLRPENKLKRPERYKSESHSEELENESIQMNHDSSESQPKSPRLIINTKGVSSTPQTLQHSHLTSPVKIPFSSNLQGAPVASQSTPKRMPKIRIVRKSSTRRRFDKHDDNEDNNSRASRPVGRSSTRSARQAPTSIYPSVKPAAFPSLPTDGPLPEKAASRHGVKEILEAMERCDQKGIETSKLRIDQMYANRKFPTSVDQKERTWYATLKQRWAANSAAEMISFTSLWPSLRQTIIEQLRDEFAPGSYYDPYHPVNCLLRIPPSTLKQIMSENSEVWNVEDDIPRYLLEWKRLHPNEIIDPDEPPALEVVKAIQFLKQEHLPGSLLGEWQFELPSIEVFRPPLMFPVPPRSKITTGSTIPGSLNCLDDGC